MNVIVVQCNIIYMVFCMIRCSSYIDNLWYFGVPKAIITQPNSLHHQPQAKVHSHLHHAIFVQRHGHRHWGNTGDVSPWLEIPGGMFPPEITIFKENFMHICQNFQIYVFKIKWPKSKEKSEFGDRWF